LSNPAERDRINAVNAMIKNSKGDVRTFVNPAKCKNLIRDFEQVAYKDGTTQIDKDKHSDMTHPSDAAGYMYEKEFGFNRGLVKAANVV